jgi:hypothetical protein
MIVEIESFAVEADMVRLFGVDMKGRAHTEFSRGRKRKYLGSESI